MHTGLIWLYRYLQFSPLFNINVLSNSVELESDWYEGLKVAMRSRKSWSIFSDFFPRELGNIFYSLVTLGVSSGLCF